MIEIAYALCALLILSSLWTIVAGLISLFGGVKTLNAQPPAEPDKGLASWDRQTTYSAVVTRYPTGYFGIDYQGSMFFWSGFVEAEVHAELKRLGIPAKQVKWEERYCDRQYDCNDPRSYKTRKFIPQQPCAPASLRVGSEHGKDVVL